MKVFITNCPFFAVDRIWSKDFMLEEGGYKYSLSSMLASKTEEGEEVRLVVCHPYDGLGNRYDSFKAELETVAKKKKLNIQLHNVFLNSMKKSNEYNNKSIFNSLEKIQKYIQAGDRVFTDLCQGLPLHIGLLFTATYYTLMTSENIDATIYGAIQYPKDGKATMELVSMSALLLLAKLSAKTSQGSRGLLNKLLLLDNNHEGSENADLTEIIDHSYYAEDEEAAANQDEDEDEDEDDDQD